MKYGDGSLARMVRLTDALHRGVALTTKWIQHEHGVSKPTAARDMITLERALRGRLEITREVRGHALRVIKMMPCAQSGGQNVLRGTRPTLDIVPAAGA